MNSFIPFALPYLEEGEIDAVVDTLRSGWITMGPKSKDFESSFSNTIAPSKYPVAVNSATAGLHLALEALGIGPGDEVIVPTWTFTASAEVVRYLGATPILCDVDAKTYNMTVSQVEPLISSKTRAIMPVHFAGLSCEMTALINLAAKHDLFIIEDAAHALPTTWDQKNIGALDTDATVFSFYATKTITTGEGGMILLKDKSVAERCRVMRLHGINRDVFDRYRSKKPSWYYEVIAPGFKYNTTDIAASLGLEQLGKLHKMQQMRQEIANRYLAEFAGLPLTLPERPRNRDLHSWHLFVINLSCTESQIRDEFIEKMYQHGIGCSVHFIPLHLQPYWRKTYKLFPGDFPCATSLFRGCVSLPIYPALSNQQVSYIIDTVKSVLEECC